MFRFSKDFNRGGAFMRGSQVILLNYRVAHIEYWNVRFESWMGNDDWFA